MSIHSGPKLIIHGGAGTALQDQSAVESIRDALHTITDQTYHQLMAGATAKEAVLFGCQLLEDHPRFNAGKGAVLQADGQIRLSASLMDGETQRFSGVINAARIEHPIQLAAFLQQETDRVLSETGTTELARELQLPIFDPATELRLSEWIRERQNNFQRSMAGVIAEPSPTARRGTIGVVALDRHGHLAAGTSTGGKGLERIGRVSDSAMPAGNYANEFAGVSCTGIGEDIIDECLAARLVIRVTDGLSLEAAFQRSFTEASRHHRDLGAIGLDKTGHIAWGKTSDILLAAFHDGQKLGDTLSLERGTQTGVIKP